MNKKLLVTLIIISFMIQLFLTYFQIKDYNKNFNEMRKYGRVGMGRIKSRLSKGVIALISVSEGYVKDCRIMRGFSVFSRFEKYSEFINLKINELEKQLKINVEYKKDNNIEKAMLLAIDMINQKN